MGVEELHLRPAAALSDEALAHAVERVYEGYAVPMRMDVDRLRRHVEVNDVDLNASLVLADVVNDVAGLALIAVRGDRGWIAGFGVAPDWRRRGVGHRLGSLVDTAARDVGLAHLQLEVFAGNAHAIRIYEQGGFEVTREVLVLNRPADAGAAGAPALPVAVAEPAAVLAAAAEAGHDPVWQREPAGVERLDELEAFVVGDLARPRAAMLLAPAGAGFVVADLWGDATAAAALTAEAVRLHAHASLTLINEPAGSPALPGLLGAGWVETGRQLEMRRRLR